MATDYVKGSIGNPYSLREYENLAENGNWLGGFVRIETDEIAYYRESFGKRVGCGCGSDCGSGCGCGCYHPTPIIVDEGCLQNSQNSDCFFRCLAMAMSQFGGSMSSDQLRLAYLRGDLDNNWSGTNSLDEYFGGPNCFSSDGASINSNISAFTNVYFNASAVNRSISSLRDSMDHPGNTATVAVYRTNSNSNSYHAVICKSNNNGLLYFNDPQRGMVLQGDEGAEYLNDSHFVFSIRLAGLKD